MKKLLFILLFIPNVALSNNYIITEIKDSSAIGKEYDIENPIFYISGLNYCNDLPKIEALNSRCIKNKKAKYRINEFNEINDPNVCSNCFNVNNKPILKLKTKFKIISEYKSESASFLSRLFEPPIYYWLVEDQDGHKIEIFKIDIELFNEKINKNEKDL